MRVLILTILLAHGVLGGEIYDQLDIHEQACGPVAWMNAQVLSDERWGDQYAALPIEVNDRFDILYRHCFRQFSSYAYMKRRWDKENGIRPDDLRDGINMMHRRLRLPKLQLSSLFLRKGESKEMLSGRVFEEIQGSLDQGFTPLLVLSRFQKIKYRNGGFRWGVVGSHVVTVTSVSREEVDLAIAYCDPWGARRLRGTLGSTDKVYFANDICAKPKRGLEKNPCMVADFEATSVAPVRVALSVESVVVASHLLLAGRE